MFAHEHQNPFRKSVLLVSFAPSEDATVEAALASIGLAVTRLSVDSPDPWDFPLACDSICSMRPTVVVMELPDDPDPGLRLCAALAERGSSAPPAVLVGDRSGEELEKKAMEVGAAGYLVRPLRPGDFLSTLGALGLWGARSQFRQPLRAPLLWTDRQGQARGGETIDLSLSGIKCATETLPESPSNIRMEILLPGQTEFVPLWLRVLRAHRDKSGRCVAAGRILQIAEADRVKLEEAIRAAHECAFRSAHPHRMTILDDYTVRQVMEWTTYLTNRVRFDGPPSPVGALEERVKDWVVRLPEEEVALFERERESVIPSGAQLVWLQALVAYRFRIEEIQRTDPAWVSSIEADVPTGFSDQARQALHLLDRSMTAWASFGGRPTQSEAGIALSNRVLKRTLRSALALRDVYEEARTADLPGFFGALRDADDYFRDLDASQISAPPVAKKKLVDGHSFDDGPQPKFPTTAPQGRRPFFGRIAALLAAIVFFWTALGSMKAQTSSVVPLDASELSELSPVLEKGRRSGGPQPVFFGELDAASWLSMSGTERRREAERLFEVLHSRGIRAGFLQRGGILAMQLGPEGVAFVE